VSLLRPFLVLQRASDLDASVLKDMDVSGLIIDIDNTIVPWRGEEPEDGVRDWIKGLLNGGISLVLVSNAGGPRAARMGETLGVPVVAPAKKPLRGGYKTALDILKLEKKHVASLGDQIFTDVLGGNRSGIKTILVPPLSEKEFAGTRLVRLVERRYRK